MLDMDMDNSFFLKDLPVAVGVRIDFFKYSVNVTTNFLEV
jgi:hypothetical protein